MSKNQKQALNSSVKTYSVKIINFKNLKIKAKKSKRSYKAWASDWAYTKNWACWLFFNLQPCEVGPLKPNSYSRLGHFND